jgi:hypothetical protein
MRALSASVFCLLLLAGCGLWNSTRDTAGDTMLGVQLSTDSASFVDRCADVLKRAYPNVRFEVTGKRLGLDASRALVDIQAHRADPPASPMTPREVAVQCRFDSGVLLDFHWTATPL